MDQDERRERESIVSSFYRPPESTWTEELWSPKQRGSDLWIGAGMRAFSALWCLFAATLTLSASSASVSNTPVCSCSCVQGLRPQIMPKVKAAEAALPPSPRPSLTVSTFCPHPLLPSLSPPSSRLADPGPFLTYLLPPHSTSPGGSASWLRALTL